MKCSVLKNQTAVTEFLLLGLPYQNQLLLVILFLILYLMSLFGNSFIIAVTNLDRQLHTPMYFFIGNLSLLDLCATSVTVPKYIHNFLFKSLSISFLGCITQIYLFIWLLTAESFLLAVMAYDRYVAVCRPLHYTTVMSEKLCVLLVVSSWMLPSLHALLYAITTFHLCFCGPNAIPNFFCDQPLVLALSCSDTSIIQTLLVVESSFIGGALVFFILSTYVWISSSIVRLRSTEACKKAFFTCSAHLTVLCLFFGTSLSVYLFPSSTTSNGNNPLESVMYALVIPVLNPFIYSLRNKEIKTAFMKFIRRKFLG